MVIYSECLYYGMASKVLMNKESIYKNIQRTRQDEMRLFNYNNTWILRAISMCKDSGKSATKKNIAKILDINQIKIGPSHLTRSIEALRNYGIIYYTDSQDSTTDFIAFNNPNFPSSKKPHPYEELTFNLKAFNRLFLNRTMFMILMYKKMDQTIVEDMPRSYSNFDENRYLEILDDIITNYTSYVNNMYLNRINHILLSGILEKMSAPIYDSQTLINFVDNVLQTISIPETYPSWIRLFKGVNMKYNPKLETDSKKFNEILTEGFVIIKEGIDKDWTDRESDRASRTDLISDATSRAMKQWAREADSIPNDLKVKFFTSKYIPSGLMAKINEDISDDYTILEY